MGMSATFPKAISTTPVREPLADKTPVANRVTESASVPLPKTKFLGKAAPHWINQLRAGLMQNGTLVEGTLPGLKKDEQEKALQWVAKKSYHQFKQDDERYTSVAATKSVMVDRAYSDKANEQIFIAGIRYTNIFGQEKFKPVSSVSLVEYDSPRMPQYGPNWGADFVSKTGYQGRGLATNLIKNHLEPMANSMGGFKLYSEPQNSDWYKHLGMFKIGDEKIVNQDKADESIDVEIFSSTAEIKAGV